jgi:hypothetical protein
LITAVLRGNEIFLWILAIGGPVLFLVQVTGINVIITIFEVF